MDISLIRFLAAYGLMIIIVMFLRIKNIGLTKDMSITVARMSAQLFIFALFLEIIFDFDKWYLVLITELIIFILASQIVLKRVNMYTKNLRRNIFISLLAGGGTILFIFLVLIVGQDPLYDPRYVIPLGGMIIGNAMKGCALAFERFNSSVKKEKMMIKTLLSMGANYKEATLSQFRESWKAAFLPELITMSAMGIVVLPGMMTGQIISGSAPITAVKYQIAIMIAIVSGNALVSYLILFLQNKEFFNKYHQLKIPEN